MEFHASEPVDEICTYLPVVHLVAQQIGKVAFPLHLVDDDTPPHALHGGTTSEAAAHIFYNVLHNCGTTSFQRDAVLINAAFGIHTIRADKSIDTCLEEARASLLSGRALKTFERFIELNQ